VNLPVYSEDGPSSNNDASMIKQKTPDITECYS